MAPFHLPQFLPTQTPFFLPHPGAGRFFAADFWSHAAAAGAQHQFVSPGVNLISSTF